MSERTLVLYLAHWSSEIREIAAELERKCASIGVGFKTVNFETDPLDVDRVLNDIRSISPQVRGKVKAGSGRPLPITNNGRLNLSNTPVAILYEENKAIDVYPKRVSGVYHSILDFKATRPMSAERILIDLLLARPELVEPDWVKVEVEAGATDEDDADTKPDSKSSRPDLLIRKKGGELVVVECKSTADQASLGQVLKQKEGFKASRAVIVCFDLKGNILGAAESSGVELFTVRLQPMPQPE
ncbi:MAG: hypothetical protein QXI37_01240 [Thermoprotei archaeon]